MKLYLISLVFLLLCVMIFCEENETLSGVEDNWVDPHKMVDDQDAGLGKWLKNNIEDEHVRNEKNSETVFTQAYANIQDDLAKCKMKLETFSSSPNEVGIKETFCDTPYFKQLVRVIYEATSDVKPSTQMNLNAEQRETLRKFSNDKANAHDVLTILLDSINNRTISDSFKDKCIFFFSSYRNVETVVLGTCFMILVLIIIGFEMRTKLTARQQFFYLIVVSFIASIPWEWYRLYKKEFARKQSIVMESIPKHCQTDHELGPIESLGLWWKSYFSIVDSSCSKYQEALWVDAVWEVPPSLAVSVTLTRFCVQPLEHIADAAGKSFRALFQHLPIQWQPLMFVACLLVVILFLVLISGFHISTPFFQIGTGFETAVRNEQLLRLENQLQGLLQNAENHNEQPPAIENVRGNDERMQHVIDITTAINEHFQQQKVQLREINNSVQALKDTCRERNSCSPEAVEHPEWEVVDRSRLPVEASEPHPTELCGGDSRT